MQSTYLAGVPTEIMTYIADYLPDARPIYLANKLLYKNMPYGEQVFWRNDEIENKYKYWPTKIPTTCDIYRFARAGNLAMVQKLEVAYDRDLFATSVLSCNISLIAYIIDKWSVSHDDINYSLYHLCIFANSVETLRYLHQKGADLGHHNNWPFIYTCHYAKFDMAIYMLQNGVSLYASGDLILTICSIGTRKSLEYVYSLDTANLLDYDRGLDRALATHNTDIISYYFENPYIINGGFERITQLIHAYNNDYLNYWLNTRMATSVVECLN